MKTMIVNLRAKSLSESPLDFRLEAEGDVATVYLYDVIDKWWGISATEFVEQLEAVNAKTINLRIDSPGGDVFQARAMATALARLRAEGAEVIAHVDGQCASAATCLAVAADKVVMSRGSFYMIHQAWTWAFGNADELIRTAELLEKVDGEIVSDYVARTGKSRDEVATMMAEETWLTADEAVENGFADDVFEVAAGAQNRAKRFNLSCYKNPPKALTEADEAEVVADNESRAAVLSRLQHMEAISKAHAFGTDS